MCLFIFQEKEIENQIKESKENKKKIKKH